jgi:hypothetical protein
MRNISRIIYTGVLAGLLLSTGGCTKLVKIPEPQNTITSAETFANVANANAAVAGIYYDMMSKSYMAGSLSADAGMSADDLQHFFTVDLFEENALFPKAGYSDGYWNVPFYNIYQVNSVLEGLQASTSLPQATVSQLTGEAKFLRAFFNFYLVNLFGDVPLVLTTSYANNSLKSRTPAEQVYRQIIDDLKDAKQRLPKDYSSSNGERIRANYWAATALLARTYLYMNKWDSAESQATEVINNTADFGLVTDLNAVFLKNSTEAILQLQRGFNIGLGTASTIEGYLFVPPDTLTPPNYNLTTYLLNTFEPGDQRRENWVGVVKISDGSTLYIIYYPYKYKIRMADAGNVTEYTMLLRLGEQYLIRAEARAHQNANLQGALEDLDVIRRRAGLPDLPGSLNQAQVLDAVAQERRVELFAEFGHRWLDLKRTNKVNEVLSPIKPLWKPTASLYPLPYQEVQTDPNLTQNPGYN